MIRLNYDLEHWEVFVVDTCMYILKKKNLFFILELKMLVKLWLLNTEKYTTGKKILI